MYGTSNVPSVKVPSVKVPSVAGPDIVLAAKTCRAPVAISVEVIYTTSGETPVVTPSKIAGVTPGDITPTADEDAQAPVEGLQALVACFGLWG